MNPIELIKDRLSIQDVVSTYLTLEKSGNQFKARCPFHNEKTPSFYISPNRNSYHCFGCNKGGDIFSFMEEIEHISFKDALVLLAEKAGVKLSSFKDGEKYDSSFNILEKSSFFFESELKKSGEAMLYLKDRGLFDETINRFHIGYAPNNWRDLYNFLKKENFTDDQIEKSGVCIKTEKGLYDRFRGRILFPINNASGKISGFTGRILPQFEKNGDKVQAKYVNSPETEIYHKSKILFGFDKAKKEILNKDLCIVVEGQMDTIMTHQVNSTNTIASSGTAFTEEQLNQIKRLTSNLALCFDRDQAGLAALKRSSQLALLSGMDVSVISFKDYKDAAELILKDKDLWHKEVENRKPVIMHLIEFYQAEETDEREFLKIFKKEIIPIMSCFSNKIDQHYFINKISDLLGIEKKIIEEELQKTNINIVVNQKEKNDLPIKTRVEIILEELFSLVELQSKDKEKKLLEVKNKIQSFESLNYYLDFPKEILNSLLIKNEHKYAGKDLETEIENLSKELDECLIEEKISDIKKELKNKNQDEDTHMSLLNSQQDLQKQLDILRKNKSK